MDQESISLTLFGLLSGLEISTSQLVDFGINQPQWQMDKKVDFQHGY